MSRQNKKARVEETTAAPLEGKGQRQNVAAIVITRMRLVDDSLKEYDCKIKNLTLFIFSGPLNVAHDSGNKLSPKTITEGILKKMLIWLETNTNLLRSSNAAGRH